MSFNAKAETVRAILTCGECSKPICLHSVKKLTDEQKRLVAQLQEDSVYVCGAPLTSPDSQLIGVVALRQGLECSTEISPHYYSCKKFPLVCYVCGSATPLPNPAAMQERYQTVHLVCGECKQKGKTERVRGERQVGAAAKKRKHNDS